MLTNVTLLALSSTHDIGSCELPFWAAVEWWKGFSIILSLLLLFKITELHLCYLLTYNCNNL